ncbi:MAG TPA: Hpt domain-containing protein [Edaphobacter sp.]|nr:Hpt domain-containing protein [Edaphobacter sp.]
MKKRTEAEVDTLIAELWQRHLPVLHERLDILDRAVAESTSGTLTEASRAEAIAVAHKLAGNLGMFGHGKSGEIAGQMEPLLKSPTPKKLRSLAALVQRLRDSLASDL